MTSGEQPAGLDGLDTGVAHISRIQNYWRGGTDYFPADRVAAEEAMAAYPDLVSSVRANQAFLARSVRYLAGEAGIRQFLDIGTGLPVAGSVHEPVTLRDQAAVRRLVAGLDLVPLGIVRVPQWRPGSAGDAATPSAQWAAVARKPAHG